jgi:hypothetical protein
MSHRRGVERLDGLLASAYEQLGVVVYDTLMGRGGPPELHDPDLALGRLLVSAHRQSGASVVKRVAEQREALRSGSRRAESAAEEPTGEEGSLLTRRPAPVRLKYRKQALRLAQDYWPQDMAALALDSLERVRELIVSLEERERPLGDDRQMLERTSARLGVVLRLPTRQLPLPVVGYDYPVAVEDYLSGHATRVMRAALSAQRLVDAELVDYLSDPETFWLAALEVAHDLADDLDLVHREATALWAAVTAVRRASTDFRGADLRSVELDGVVLQGITWDAATAWPAEWEERIRWASQAVDDDQRVLVVGIEPHDSTVSADI